MMLQRLLDYGVVFFVVVAMYGLFRLARHLLEKLLSSIARRHGALSSDSVLLLGFFTLLTGLLLLPVVTWGDNPLQFRGGPLRQLPKVPPGRLACGKALSAGRSSAPRFLGGRQRAPEPALLLRADGDPCRLLLLRSQLPVLRPDGPFPSSCSATTNLSTSPEWSHRSSGEVLAAGSRSWRFPAMPPCPQH
jgi:hypothetical protein